MVSIYILNINELFKVISIKSIQYTFGAKTFIKTITSWTAILLKQYCKQSELFHFISILVRLI